jgi:hypothetical protein
MKQFFKTILALVLFIGCLALINKPSTELPYSQIIEKYLEAREIKPTVVFNANGKRAASLLTHKITWKQVNKGLAITIDGVTINSSDEVTLNKVSDNRVYSVEYANSISQIKLYEPKSLIGFELAFEPCNGLGCSIAYHLVYDLKTGKTSYFGRFRTDLEFNIYNFNSDSIPDYLSATTICEVHPRVTDSIEYIMYSQSSGGDFKVYRNENQEKFWFRHIFHRDYAANDIRLLNEELRENWIEKITLTSKQK